MANLGTFDMSGGGDPPGYDQVVFNSVHRLEPDRRLTLMINNVERKYPDVNDCAYEKYNALVYDMRYNLDILQVQMELNISKLDELRVDILHKFDEGFAGTGIDSIDDVMNDERKSFLMHFVSTFENNPRDRFEEFENNDCEHIVYIEDYSLSYDFSIIPKYVQNLSSVFETSDPFDYRLWFERLEESVRIYMNDTLSVRIIFHQKRPIFCVVYDVDNSNNNDCDDGSILSINNYHRSQHHNIIKHAMKDMQNVYVVAVNKYTGKDTSIVDLCRIVIMFMIVLPTVAADKISIAEAINMVDWSPLFYIGLSFFIMFIYNNYNKFFEKFNKLDETVNRVGNYVDVVDNNMPKVENIINKYKPIINKIDDMPIGEIENKTNKIVETMNKVNNLADAATDILGISHHDNVVVQKTNDEWWGKAAMAAATIGIIRLIYLRYADRKKETKEGAAVVIKKVEYILNSIFVVLVAPIFLMYGMKAGIKIWNYARTILGLITTAFSLSSSTMKMVSFGYDLVPHSVTESIASILNSANEKITGEVDEVKQGLSIDITGEDKDEFTCDEKKQNPDEIEMKNMAQYTDITLPVQYKMCLKDNCELNNCLRIHGGGKEQCYYKVNGIKNLAVLDPNECDKRGRCEGLCLQTHNEARDMTLYGCVDYVEGVCDNKKCSYKHIPGFKGKKYYSKHKPNKLHEEIRGVYKSQEEKMYINEIKKAFASVEEKFISSSYVSVAIGLVVTLLLCAIIKAIYDDYYYEEKESGIKEIVYVRCEDKKKCNMKSSCCELKHMHNVLDNKCVHNFYCNKTNIQNVDSNSFQSITQYETKEGIKARQERQRKRAEAYKQAISHNKSSSNKAKWGYDKDWNKIEYYDDDSLEFKNQLGKRAMRTLEEQEEYEKYYDQEADTEVVDRNGNVIGHKQLDGTVRGLEDWESGERKIVGCAHMENCPLKTQMLNSHLTTCNTKCGGHHCIHWKECKIEEKIEKQSLPEKHKEDKESNGYNYCDELSKKGSCSTMNCNKTHDFVKKRDGPIKNFKKSLDKSKKQVYIKVELCNQTCNKITCPKQHVNKRVCKPSIHKQKDCPYDHSTKAELKETLCQFYYRNNHCDFGNYCLRKHMTPKELNSKVQEVKESLHNGAQFKLPLQKIAAIGMVRSETQIMNCTLINDRIITCAHVSSNKDEVLEFEFRKDGKLYLLKIPVTTGKLVGYDILSFPIPTELKEFPKFSASQSYKVSDKIQIHTYTSEQNFADGIISNDSGILQDIEKIATPTNGIYSKGIYVISTLPGTCGSPVVNTEGKVIGIHNATRNDVSVCLLFHLQMIMNMAQSKNWGLPNVPADKQENKQGNFRLSHCQTF